MPSLFLWKALTPLTTSTSLSYYSGSNWFLEEHSTYSKSAIYLNQQNLSNHGWMYDIKWMPTNWVGSYLLENESIPYALIKEDTLGRLEQFGDWMRFTTYREVDDKEEEWKRIQQWTIALSVKSSVKPSVKSSVKQLVHLDTSYEPCLINLSAGFTTSFTPSHSPVSHMNYRKSTQPHRQHSYQKKRMILA